MTDFTIQLGKNLDNAQKIFFSGRMGKSDLDFSYAAPCVVWLTGRTFEK